MRDKITKRTVEVVEPAVRDTFLWDSEIPGFGCKVTPKGARIYLLQYGRNGRDHRVTIGRHGVELTAEQARNEARRLRGLIASGENPAAERLRDRSMPTVAELGRRYLEEYARSHKKPSGLAQDRRNLDNHIIPLIGSLKVSEIERQDVTRVMRDVAAGKTAKDEKTKLQGRRIVRGGEIVANRVHALLSKMFELAEDWKFRPAGANPCCGAKRFAEHKVERFLSLAPVDVHGHLVRITVAARFIMALKLVSVLQALMAIRLNSLSFWKKFSTRCRHLYISASWVAGLRRPLLAGMTASTPLLLSKSRKWSAS